MSPTTSIQTQPQFPSAGRPSRGVLILPQGEGCGRAGKPPHEKENPPGIATGWADNPPRTHGGESDKAGRHPPTGPHEARAPAREKDSGRQLLAVGKVEPKTCQQTVERLGRQSPTAVFELSISAGCGVLFE